MHQRSKISVKLGNAWMSYWWFNRQGRQQSEAEKERVWHSETRFKGNWHVLG